MAPTVRGRVGEGGVVEGTLSEAVRILRLVVQVDRDRLG